ncbi:MAG: hemin-degrading factor [Candidatus Cyclobacteriaceae bacterium M2_1C_046]
MKHTINSLNSAEQIEQAWNGIQQAKSGIRIREAASALGLSEAQLLATQVGKEAIRLKADWPAFMKRLPELGRIMSLTRNDSCILEHKGAFEKIRVSGKSTHQMATVIGPIESRVFLKSWHVAFAVKQKKGDRLLTSLQVFDHEGQAITKIYLQEDSNYEAYEAFVADFRAEDQSRKQVVSTYDKKEFTKDLDKEAFLNDWSGLKDTHDFFPLLRKYNADRFHAIQIAEGRFSYPIAVSNIQEMLENASKQKLPIMIFAGNRGNIQIHQDKVRTIRLLERGHTGEERWLNVLDPDFNMHLRIDLIKTAWVVTKPTRDGDVTSIECYDHNNELAVQFFGLRKPGCPELTEWKELVNSLGKMPAIV